MMNKLVIASLLFLLASCAAVKKVSRPDLQPYVDSISKQYAPDQRSVLFSVAATGKLLRGETTDPSAKNALFDQLKANNIEYVDSITVLPHASLGSKKFAVVINSVANLRVQPRHQAELSTQATMGTPLKVLKKERGWYFVQSPDHYLAWVDGGAVEWMDSTSFEKWQSASKMIFIKPYGFAYEVPLKTAGTISDLVYGDVFSYHASFDGFIAVKFPDDRLAFIPSEDVLEYKEWASSRNPITNNLISTAKDLMGLPYLWGGTSFKGVDCSGFTKTVYFMNGLILPRDASQQAYVGALVEMKNGWKDLQPGDLLFFGRPERNDTPARVVHVGMWLGNNDEFIHSSGRVMVGSMNPEASNYDEGEHKRFLWARRITSRDAIVDLRNSSLFEKK